MSMRAVAIAFCAVLATVAAENPNFSGVWQLNKTESDYGAKGASLPDRLTRTVQQKGNSLKYKVEREKDGRKGSFEVEVEIGGQPFESNEAGVVSASWHGQTLSIETLFNPGSDRSSSQVENWTLSADGKKLVDEYVATRHDGGQTHIRRVFDKVQ
jgi:hypothetical protein